MHTLTCQAISCIYNDSRRCSANVIRVGVARQETFCDTYTKADSFVADQADKVPRLTDNISDAEFSAELTDSPRISCTATACVYNKAFRCRARGVEIDDPRDTDRCRCITFRQK